MREKLNNYLISIGFENVTDDKYIQGYVKSHNVTKGKEYYRTTTKGSKSELVISCEYDTVSVADVDLRPKTYEVIYLDYVFTNETYSSFNNITSFLNVKSIYHDTDLNGIYLGISRWLDTDKIVQNRISKILDIK